MECQVRLLYHAINGTGLGHLARLSSIARVVADLDSDVQQLVVTGSSYTELLDGLAVPFLVLPHDDSSPFSGTDLHRATVPRLFATSLLFRIIQDYTPSLVVFDTHFSGKLVQLLSHQGVESVLVLRLCRERYLRMLLRDDALSAFSLVLMPHEEEELRHELSEEFASQLASHPGYRILGPIVRSAAPQSVGRTADLLAMLDGRPLILITCGAGGYRHQASVFVERATAAAVRLRQEQLPGAEILVVGGPLGAPNASLPGCRFIRSEPNLPALLARARLVIGHGGYNTVHEVLQAGVRALLVPMPRQNESQERRVARLAGAGRITSVSLEASAKRYHQALTAALSCPRPQAETFSGAEKAARELLARAHPAPRLALLGGTAPAGWTAVDDEASLLAGLEQHERAFVLVSGEKVDALASAPDVRRAPPRGWVVDLGLGAADELARRAAQVFEALEPLGAPVSFVFTDERGGPLLRDLCDRLADLPLRSLIAKVPTHRLLETADERFATFEVMRQRPRGFKVDITSLERPTVMPGGI